MQQPQQVHAPPAAGALPDCHDETAMGGLRQVVAWLRQLTQARSWRSLHWKVRRPSHVGTTAERGEASPKLQSSQKFAMSLTQQ